MRALIFHEIETKTILMVDQNVIAGTDVANNFYEVELGSNKPEATKDEFDTAQKRAIAD